MTATYQIKSAALSPQFIHELQEKYGETELEIRVQTGGTRSQILSDAQFWQIIDLLDWEESGDDEAVVFFEDGEAFVGVFAGCTIRLVD